MGGCLEWEDVTKSKFPETAGRYQIRRELGRGGMSRVFLAHDPVFEREVAIKILPHEWLDDDQYRARFIREARLIATLEHPAIVPVYDFGEQDGHLFLVMRYMSEATLHERIQSGHLSIPETATVLGRIASALNLAHQNGIIHRDLKPANILFDAFGEAYLSDFGIARMAEGRTTLSGRSIIGTPAYMSPEQARGDHGIDHRTDIYSLGVVLFEMLTGRIPYEADTPTGQLIRHLNDPIPDVCSLRGDLPGDCQAVIDRAMAKEPADRYTTALELAADVQELSGRMETARREQAASLASSPQALTLFVGQPLDEAGAGIKTTVPELPVSFDRNVTHVPQSGATRVVESPAPPATQGIEKRGALLWRLATIPVIVLLLVGLYLVANMLLSILSPANGQIMQAAQPGRAVTASPQASATPIFAEPDIPLGNAIVWEAGNNILYDRRHGGKDELLMPGAEILAGEDTQIMTMGGPARLELSDGAVITMGNETSIWLLGVAGPGSQAGQTQIRLDKGTLLVNAADVHIIAALEPFQAWGRYAIMGVSYDPNRGQFFVDCLDGSCLVGDEQNPERLSLTAGQRSGFEQGELMELDAAQRDEWVILNPEVLQSLAPTSTRTATATALSTSTPVYTPPPTESPPPTRRRPRPTDTPQPPNPTDTPPPLEATGTPYP